MTDPDQTYFTYKEVQERLKLCPSKIYQLARAGELEIVKFGRSSRVTRESLQRLMDRAPRRAVVASKAA